MGQICFLKRGRRKRGEEREKEGRRGGKKEKKRSLEGQSPKKEKFEKIEKRGLTKREGSDILSERSSRGDRSRKAEGSGRRERNGP